MLAPWRKFHARALISVNSQLAWTLLMFLFRPKLPSESSKEKNEKDMTIDRKPIIAIVGVAFVAAMLLGADAAEERIRISEITHVHGIAVDPRDPSRLFLATHDGVFLASLDGTAERVSDDRNDYMGFTPHPGDTNTLYASGHPAGGGNMGFIVSRDGGLTWQQISAGAGGPVDFHAMDVSAADPDVIYGLYGTIQVSRDGGQTWEIAGAPPGDVFDIAASAVTPDIVYAATRGGLMVSRDGARSWEATGPAGQPATMVQVAPNGSVYAFVYGTGLTKAPGVGLTWQPVSTGFGQGFLVHLAIDRSNPSRMFAVDNEGQVLASTDGGHNWASLGS
jgi:photosystem II stability/assembly factor-like uncharacterized protein